MFIQNQIKDLPNHYETIKEQAKNANEINLIVSYVRQTGVNTILDDIRNKKVKLLCSLDMGITQQTAIKELIENNVTVKVYRSKQGTFHSKIWLFKTDKYKWNCIIGSANLTGAALFDNVEASVLIENQNDFNGVISNSIIFFNYLWESDNVQEISISDLSGLKNKIENRKKINKKIQKAEKENISEKYNILLEFIKSWIDIDKYETSKNMIGTLWRGWYIIPDQGYITDEKISFMQKILQIISENSGLVVLENTDNGFQKIYDLVSNQNFKRKNHKLDYRSLFVRTYKNYLLKFGFAYHPPKSNGKLDKNTLIITQLGKQIAKANNITEIKSLYTDYLYNYEYNGLQIVKFTEKIIEKLDYINFHEFNYFVIHAYSFDDLDEIIKLIKYYRELPEHLKNKLDTDFTDHFKKIKEPTAKSVLSNYIKKVKHQMTAIGWCEMFSFNYDNLKITT